MVGAVVHIDDLSPFRDLHCKINPLCTFTVNVSEGRILTSSTALMDPDTLLKGGAALAAGLVLHAMAQPKQPAKNRKGSAYDGKVSSSWG